MRSELGQLAPGETPNVLVACEESGAVAGAFAALGANAWSADIQPSSAGPDARHRHYQGDAFDVLRDPGRFFGGPIHLLIAHPPCTYLCAAGVSWLTGETRATPETKAGRGRWDQMRESAALFWEFLHAPELYGVPRVAVENPKMHGYAAAMVEVSPTGSQMIHPWEFGHLEQKETGLWLRGLPPLMPTDDVRIPMRKLPPRERQRIWYASPGEDRGKLRSKTFPGIADAMAAQWLPIVAADLEEAAA